MGADAEGRGNRLGRSSEAGQPPPATLRRGESGGEGEYLTVLMPAYNEAPHIRANIEKTSRALSGFDHRIVVVDDGSTDSTLAECRDAAQRGFPVAVVRQPANAGKGAALIRGFRHAQGELVAFLDADLEIPPSYLAELVLEMEATGDDIVIGVREGDGESSFPPARRALSRLYRLLVGWLFGFDVSETQAGIKLFRREVLEDCLPRITARRFAFDVELLAAASRFGFSIGEVPVRVEYVRSGGLGRMSAGHVAHTLLETLSIYYRASFWTWLQPGGTTKLWMLTLGLGIFLLGIGVSKLVTPLVLQGPLKQLFYVVALQFLPRTGRDWLVALAGLVLAAASLVHLNRSLMAAFARVDRGDLAGILQTRTKAVEQDLSENETIEGGPL